MSKELPPIESLNDLEAAHIDPPVPIIDGLIDCKGKMMLVGQAKTNKSWLLMALNYAVSYPLPAWWGMKVHPHKVLYINFELERWDFRDRMRQISKAYGHEVINNPNCDCWNLRGAARNYVELNAVIRQRFTKAHYGMVTIDPFYKYNASGKVENAAEDMAAVMNALEELAVDMGFAVVFAHHPAKGNMAERAVVDRGSGSGVFGRDPDAIVTIHRLHDDEEEFKAEFALRRHPPKDPLGLRFKHPLMVPDNRVQTSVRTSDNAAELLAILPASGYTNADWARAAKEKLNMASSTYYKWRSELHMKDLVECVSNVWVPMTPGKV